MANEKKNKSDNTWLIVTLAALGVTSVGLFAWARSQSGEGGSSSSGSGSGSSSGAIGKASLPEVAKSIREATLIVDGCTVTWRVGESSRAEVLGHRDDFFVPAIVDARSKGASTIDEITAHLAALLVPGCPWPPAVLQPFDIEAGLGNRLPLVQKQMWNIAMTNGSVQLYLTLRQVVTALAVQHRRG